MNTLTFQPKQLSGDIRVPTSKSYGHRAIICASLSKGKSVIKDISMNNDIIATINAMRALGTEIIVEGNTLYIDGTHTFEKDNITIDCNESGSTLRFMIPISLIGGRHVSFLGRGKLGERPMDVYYSIFDRQSIHYHVETNSFVLDIQGTLMPDTFEIPGDISSQFITGLLFTLPLLKNDSIITLTSPLQSKAYIDLTIDTLSQFGITIKSDENHFYIKGNQTYQNCDYTVEGDYSQGAVYLCAGAIHNDVNVLNLSLSSLQGDKEILSYLNSMNCLIHQDNGLRVSGTKLKETVIDAGNCPDIMPVLSVVMALTPGVSRIVNALRLRYKECDRLHAICDMLGRNGVKVEEYEDEIVIHGVSSFTGGEVDVFHDHRMVMMAALISTRADHPVIINDKECIKKSYPDFYKDIQDLGGLYECELGQ